MTPLAALQRALAGEHAAVYMYGVLGARVSSATRPRLASRLAAAYAVHRGRRDQLTAMVATAKGDPVAAETSYRLPTPARTWRQLAAAAAVLESRSAQVYAQTVGSTAQADRQWAIDALQDAAVRQLSFGGAPDPFPGLPEL